MLERTYQAKLIKKLRLMFPGCVVLKNDPNYIQGFPDLLVLIGDRWFALEVKVRRQAAVRPNQEYYVDLLDNLSFAAFIYPENEEDVLDEIQRSLNLSG